VTSIGIVAPGSDQTSSLAGFPRYLEDTLTWRLVNEADGSEVIAESSDDIESRDIGDQQHPRYDRAYTAPDDAGRYREIWRSGSQEVVLTIAVAADPPAFATAADVASRLGQDLTAGDEIAATWLTQMATSLIAEAAGKGDDWALTLDPVPLVLKGLCVELAVRAAANPGGLTALREQLGSYSYSQQFRDVGLLLTDVEEQIVRRVVHGATTAGVKVPSGFGHAEGLLRREMDGPIQWIGGAG
jgi:hypothetical protein